MAERDPDVPEYSDQSCSWVSTWKWCNMRWKIGANTKPVAMISKRREDRVGSCKNLSSRGFQLAHWPHAGQNHRRIDVRICERHILECGIAGHSNRQADEGNYAP